jgi:hypothetical protein
VGTSSTTSASGSPIRTDGAAAAFSVGTQFTVTVVKKEKSHQRGMILDRTNDGFKASTRCKIQQHP